MPILKFAAEHGWASNEPARPVYAQEHMFWGKNGQVLPAVHGVINLLFTIHMYLMCGQT